MSIAVIHIGDIFHVTAEFLDQNDNPADPTTVALHVKDPSGNTDIYSYGQSPGGLTKDSTGNYSGDIPADESGDWHYQWVSTGNAAGGEPGQFCVAPSHFS